MKPLDSWAPFFGWLLLAAAFLSVCHAAARAGTINPDAVAFQDDPAHDGSVTFQNFTATPTKLWSVNLGAQVSYPVIAQGEVVVVSGLKLYALNAATGQTNWSVALSGISQDAPTYDNGDVFVVNNSVGTQPTMNAYNATTGASLWSKPLTGQGSFYAPPTASNGIVYVTGEGVNSTVYALRESDGATLWTAATNGALSTPTVTSSGVYVSYIGPQTYDFNPASGSLIWQLSSNTSGGGGKTSVYYNGNLYARALGDPSFPPNMMSVNAATGQRSTAFNDSAFGQATPPAFASGRGYVVALVSGVTHLQEFDPASGAVGWSLTSPGGTNDFFETAPTIINGDVFEGSSLGHVYEFNGLTGQLIQTLNAGSDILGPIEYQEGPLVGLSAGDGLLAVPATDSLTAYSVVTPEPPAVVLAIMGLSLGTIAVARRKHLKAGRANLTAPSQSCWGRGYFVGTP